MACDASRSKRTRERSSLENFEAEQRKIGQEAMDSYKINGAAVIFCLVALWWDASQIGAGAVLAMIALYNFGFLWYNKLRLDRANEREMHLTPPTQFNLAHDHEI